MAILRGISCIYARSQETVHLAPCYLLGHVDSSCSRQRLMASIHCRHPQLLKQQLLQCLRLSLRPWAGFLHPGKLWHQHLCSSPHSRLCSLWWQHRHRRQSWLLHPRSQQVPLCPLQPHVRRCSVLQPQLHRPQWHQWRLPGRRPWIFQAQEPSRLLLPPWRHLRAQRWPLAGQTAL